MWSDKEATEIKAEYESAVRVYDLAYVMLHKDGIPNGHDGKTNFEREGPGKDAATFDTVRTIHENTWKAFLESVNVLVNTRHNRNRTLPREETDAFGHSVALEAQRDALVEFAVRDARFY